MDMTAGHGFEARWGSSSAARMVARAMFLAGDLLYAAGLGALIASLVPHITVDFLPMPLQMFQAMAIGMAMATVVSLLGSFLLGMFETMTNGMWVGMTASMVDMAGPLDIRGRLIFGLAMGALVWLLFAALNLYYLSGDTQTTGGHPATQVRTKAAPLRRLAFWDRAAPLYDLVLWGSERRQREEKLRAFFRASGRVLLVGIGTGKDLSLLPKGSNIIAVDISSGMLGLARSRTDSCYGKVAFVRCDIQQAPFRADLFDTAVCSCVFCSVPDPVKGLEEVRRVLKPGGRLIMFEHVLSLNPLLALTLRSMNYLSSGPDLTRDTVENARRAGFDPVMHRNVYMDIVKHIEATKLPFPH